MLLPRTSNGNKSVIGSGSWLVGGGGGTMVSFIPKDETLQNVKKPKKIVRLNFLDALMCPKAYTFCKIPKVEICQF